MTTTAPKITLTAARNSTADSASDTHTLDLGSTTTAESISSKTTSASSTPTVTTFEHASPQLDGRADSPPPVMVDLPTYDDVMSTSGHSDDTDCSTIMDGPPPSWAEPAVPVFPDEKQMPATVLPRDASIPKEVTADASTVSLANSSPHNTRFSPTVHLEIHAAGKRFLSLPRNTPADPIAITIVSAGTPIQSRTGCVTPSNDVPLYISLRSSRCNSSSWLVRGGDPEQTPLCSTIYRAGPFKPPHVRMLVPAPSALELQTPTESSDIEKGNLDQATISSPPASAPFPSPLSPTYPATDDFEVESPKKAGMFCRTQTFRSHLGSFEWRYADKVERAAEAASLYARGAIVDPQYNRTNNLPKILFFERIEDANSPDTKAPRRRRKVAQLVRVGRGPAGVGGRLMIDLREWVGGDEAASVEGVDLGPQSAAQDHEGAVKRVQQATQLVVATCLLMLKKEVDRRRMQQAVIMVGATGGLVM